MFDWTLMMVTDEATGVAAVDGGRWLPIVAIKNPLFLKRWVTGQQQM